MFQEMRKELVTLLTKEAYQYSQIPFTLASGNKSNHYVDCRKVTFSQEGARLIGNLVLYKVLGQPFGVKNQVSTDISSIGGLTLGADPIAYATMMVARENGIKINCFSVRKEAKNHGTRTGIEGCYKIGQKVVIVEDVITTGASTLQAIDSCISAGLKVVKVIAIVNRQEGGIEKIIKKVPITYSLVQLSEITDEFKRLTK